MRETEIVERIRRMASHSKHPSVRRGIGDDCAILRPKAGEDLVFTTDLALEDRHFTLDTHSAADIGHKALARSLSDLAAMGARPVFCLVSLALPPDIEPRWIDGFYRGLLALARKHRVTLAGGDLASFTRVVIDVTCCGSVPTGKAMERSAAKPGDGIYVTGRLGGAAHAFFAGGGRGWQRHLRPQPRIAAGLAIQRIGVRACMDLSDGLALDLHRLSKESKLSADLDGALPLSPKATRDEAFYGGEDYELLFTAPANLHIPSRLAGELVTRIGTMRPGKAGALFDAGTLLPAQGFDHFAKPLSMPCKT